MTQPIPIYNGPIAVLDLLGFKKFVETNSLQDVISSYAHEITGVAHASNILKEDLQFMFYSDTIAIRLVNLTDDGFLNFIKALQLIASVFFVKSQVPVLKAIPLRGAIVIGEYSWHIGDITAEFFDRPPLMASKVNFIVGQAIIEAHEHESSQQWIGISMNEVMAKIASERFPQAWKKILDERYLVNYNIPLKSSTIAGLVVNPTMRPVFKGSFTAFIERCDAMFNNKDELFETKLKYFNTMLFLDEIHRLDYLCPYFAALSKEGREQMKAPLDKSRFIELVKYFEETIKKEHINNQINSLKSQLQALESL